MFGASSELASVMEFGFYGKKTSSTKPEIHNVLHYAFSVSMTSFQPSKYNSDDCGAIKFVPQNEILSVLVSRLHGSFWLDGP